MDIHNCSMCDGVKVSFLQFLKETKLVNTGKYK